jgi:hypothetical protein
VLFGSWDLKRERMESLVAVYWSRVQDRAFRKFFWN